MVAHTGVMLEEGIMTAIEDHNIQMTFITVVIILTKMTALIKEEVLHHPEVAWEDQEGIMADSLIMIEIGIMEEDRHL